MSSVQHVSVWLDGDPCDLELAGHDTTLVLRVDTTLTLHLGDASPAVLQRLSQLAGEAADRKTRDEERAAPEPDVPWPAVACAITQLNIGGAA